MRGMPKKAAIGLWNGKNIGIPLALTPS